MVAYQGEGVPLVHQNVQGDLYIDRLELHSRQYKKVANPRSPHNDPWS